MSDLLYPTELASHPQPGTLAAFRDGLFGRRPPEPYGEREDSYDNGVFGPSLSGRGRLGRLGRLGTVDPAPLDAGPLRSYRDGIFNFPRRVELTPHPVTAYQDGIFGGASLGQDTAEAPSDVDAGTSAASDGGGGIIATASPAPAPVVLDLTNYVVVTEVWHFLIEAAVALGYAVPPSADIDKSKWDAQCSALVDALVTQAAAANPADASTIQTYGVKRDGDASYPTAPLLFMIASSAAARGYVMDPAAYPALSAYFTACMARTLAGPAPETIADAAAYAELACPIKYPKAGISRATLYTCGAVAVGGSLLYLLLRR